MKKFKTLLAVLLAVTVLLSVFAACGKDKDSSAVEDSTAVSTTAGQETAKTVEDPLKDEMEISVGIWGITEDHVNPDKDKAYTEMAKKLNIKVKAANLTWDDYSQKIQIWAASDQLPDVFAIDALGSQYRTNWIKQGIVRALPEDLSPYPELQKVMSNADVEGMKINGKHYTIPRVTYPSLLYNTVDRMLFYRWDWCQQLGITKEPETMDELKAMLQAFVQKDPEGKKTVGLTTIAKMHIGYLWLPYAPANISDGSGTDYKWIKEDGKFIPSYFSKNTVTGLKAMKDLYDAGAIDKDIPIMKVGEGTDKFYAGKAGAVIAHKLDTDSFEKNYKGKKLADCVKIMKIPAAADGNRYQPAFKTFWSESYISSKVDDKKAGRIARLFDFLMSDEGRRLFTFGIESVDYKMEGDKVVLTDKSVVLTDKYPSMGTFGALGTWGDANGLFTYNPTTDGVPYFDMVRNYVKWTEQNCKIPETYYQLTYLSTPTKDKFVILDHDDIFKVMSGKKTAEETWADLLKDYEAKGLQKMIDEVNAKAAEMGLN